MFCGVLLGGLKYFWLRLGPDMFGVGAVTEKNKQKIAMTLLVRDEEDIIYENIWHHYMQGVSSFIVMDNKSRDRTAEIIREASGFVSIDYVYQGRDDYNQSEWVTQMARRAKEKFDADWVINSDADEFWCHSEGRISDFLSALPADIGCIDVPRFNAVMINSVHHTGLPETHPRRSVIFDLESTNSLGKPLPSKCLHRGSEEVLVASGNHSVENIVGKKATQTGLRIFHYPYRTLHRYEQKIAAGGAAYARNTSLPAGVGITWRRQYEELKRGDLRSFWESCFVPDEESQINLVSGRFFEDSSVKDAVQAGDCFRGISSLKRAAIKLKKQSLDHVLAEKKYLINQLNALSPEGKTRSPLYKNIKFLVSGMNRQVDEIERIIGALSSGVRPELDEIRDVFSLHPKNPYFAAFIREFLFSEARGDAELLVHAISGKIVVLHVSCKKYIERAKASVSSFERCGDDFVHVILTGGMDTVECDGRNPYFEFQENVLCLPVDDAYEGLHEKIFLAMFLMYFVAAPRLVIKVDDNIHLGDAEVFCEMISHVESLDFCCYGRIVGMDRHDHQLHGWHIGKCKNSSLHSRGYTYPLPRRYPAGGYGYILSKSGLGSCAQMFLSMKEFFKMNAICLEDAFVGHAIDGADGDMMDISDHNHLLSLPGLKCIS